MRGRVEHLGFVLPGGGGTLIGLRVTPGAKRAGIRGGSGEDALKLAVAAPPADGKADAEVEISLADTSRSGVEVVPGSSGRDKTDFVGGIDVAKVRGLLSGEVR